MPNASKMREQLQIHTLRARALKQQVFRPDMQAVNVAFTCGANNEEKYEWVCVVVALLQQLLPQGIIWQPSFEKMPTTTHISCPLYFWCMQTGEWVEKLFHEYLADFRDPTMYWMLWALFWICQNACSFKAAQFSSMGKEYVRADVTAHGACVCDLQCGCLNACSKKNKVAASHPCE